MIIIRKISSHTHSTSKEISSWDDLQSCSSTFFNFVSPKKINFLKNLPSIYFEMSFSFVLRNVPLMAKFIAMTLKSNKIQEGEN